MPSPFPGMDPYLESPYIWPDFHHNLASVLHTWLNRNLPKPYYARLELRPEIGVVEDEAGYVRRIIPGVSVIRHPGREPAVALANPPVAAVSESFEVTIASETAEHPFIEVRDPTQGHQLVTLIEIVSPTNKNSGADRNAYFKKQAEILASETNLIEIDLLRGGKRLFAALEMSNIIARRPKRVDYLVLVNRAWKRKVTRLAYQVFPGLITEPLPIFPVPLRQAQPEILVNLQDLFRIAYDEGPYARGAVDYAKPLHPRLPVDLENWAEQYVRQAGLIPSSP